MSKINTKDVTNSSVGTVKAIGKRNSGAKTPVSSSPKDELKATKAQKKELTAALKGLEKQEKKLQKQLKAGKKSKKA